MRGVVFGIAGDGWGCGIADAEDPRGEGEALFPAGGDVAALLGSGEA